MVRSFTLVRVKPPKEKEVYKQLIEFSEVKEAVMTYGEYDLIVEINVDSLDGLDSFIFDKLRSINGVEATTTLIEARPIK
jgi:DNA-binding Lrp family transcriptional regulator